MSAWRQAVVRGGARVVLGLQAALVVLWAAVVFAQGAAADLPDVPRLKLEAHRLRVENAQLRATLAEVRAELDSLRLSAERQALEDELRDLLQPPAGSRFDWSTGRFLPPQEPKP